MNGKRPPWANVPRIVRTSVVIGILTVSSFFAGCKRSAPTIVEAEGVITFEGKPVKNATVRFVPVGENGHDFVATGVTDDSGHFQLTCKGKPGACTGKNIVTVSEAGVPHEVRNNREKLSQYLQSLGERLPKAYSNLAQSPLRADVKAGEKDYSFELETSPPGPED